MSQANIRNFCVIAHIDHGKSTLADRLLELTHTVAQRDMHAQILDSNPIEQERGITIKLAPVRMHYKSQYPIHNTQQGAKKLDIACLPARQGDCDLEIANSEYILNLIDTPGHVDFGYEVSRSLAACEGALLVVDATQGVQAQTLANLHQARAHHLTVIPLINKIDMPQANIAGTRESLESLGFHSDEMIEISAKTGANVEKVLEAIITRIPSPRGDSDKPLRALIFSSQYDTHKGVVVFVRVVDGSIHYDPELRLRFMASKSDNTPIEVGYFSPQWVRSTDLHCGEVGYIATGLKDVKLAKVGDTVTSLVIPGLTRNPSLSTNTGSRLGGRDDIQPLTGYKEPKSMVFLGLFPLAADEYQDTREAVEKLRLSDSAFNFRPISSLALGNGFHCGFLGLLHAEVVQERILREFGLTMIATAPSVEYHLTKTNSEQFSIQSAEEFPDPSQVAIVKEPIMSVDIYSPKKYTGAIMQLSQEKRGVYMDLTYMGDQAHFVYLIPLSEMIVDFFDRLKSVTEGYASLDYEFFDWQSVEVVKVDLLVNKEKVDALSFLITRDASVFRSRELVERLATVIPRQQFEIPIQATIGGSVIARADVKAFRKDVTKKLYGGDRTRKDKLLEAQKKGKAKMKRIGRVQIPQSAFFAVLKRG